MSRSSLLRNFLQSSFPSSVLGPSPSQHPVLSQSRDYFSLLCAVQSFSVPMRRSATSQLLASRLRITLWAQMFVSCVCFVLCRQRTLRTADHLFRGVLPLYINDTGFHSLWIIFPLYFVK